VGASRLCEAGRKPLSRLGFEVKKRMRARAKSLSKREEHLRNTLHRAMRRSLWQFRHVPFLKREWLARMKLPARGPSEAGARA